MNWINVLLAALASITWAGFFAFLGVVVISIIFLAVLLCLLMPDEIQELYYPEDAE
jgi:Mg2+/Co2+ transporter CorB